MITIQKIVMNFVWISCFLHIMRLDADETHQKTVLVVGGAGFIGSHVNEMLYRQGYQTIILDNLSSGDRRAVLHGTLIEGDFGDTVLLDQIFTSHQIDAVMHFAAYIEVGESVIHPFKYYENNVIKTLILIEAMCKHHVNVLMFSSTAAIFGDSQNIQELYVSEDYPKHPINPYGRSKLMIEQVLPDFEHAHNLRSCCFRYFNATGGDPEGKIKNYKAIDKNFIPIILRQLQAENGLVTIFGTDYPTADGTGVRDYIHVMDLATAHIAAMEKLFSGSPSTHYNLGNGAGYSVKEVIDTAKKITGLKVNVIEGARRIGDPAIVIADSAKAKRELNWCPRYTSLDIMIEHAWQSMNFPK